MTKQNLFVSDRRYFLVGIKLRKSCYQRNAIGVTVLEKAVAPLRNKPFVLVLSVCVAMAGLPAVDCVESVDPFIGTAAAGNTYPGPSAPFSLIQPGPECANKGPWRLDGKGSYEERHLCSGYKKALPILLGFTQTHLSGTGCSDLGDFLIQPFCGDVPKDGRILGFKDPATERARCAYYAVTQTNLGTRVEITCSPRAAIYRIHWTGKGARRLLLDLQYVNIACFVRDKSRVVAEVAEEPGADCASFGVARKTNGWLENRRAAGFFRFSKPWTSIETLPPGPDDKGGRHVLTFDLADGEPLEVRVAVSGTDIAGARRNLETEAGSSVAFEGMRKATEEQWRALLSRVCIEGDDAQRTILYTSLYHCYVQPNVFTDVDGRVRDTSGKVGVSDGPIYTGFSLWDTFRAVHPLYTLLAPEVVDPCINSFLLQYRAQGRLPIIPYFGRESNCMIGVHSIPVIADAYVKGFRGFDAYRALEACTNTLTNCARLHSDILDKFGYYPFDHPDIYNQSVSRTLEIAYDEACVAVLAEAMGEKAVAAHFRKRSERWRTLFDKGTLFMRGRDCKGRWREPFSPRYDVCGTHGGNGDYTEANAWRYTWFVPHDPIGLIDAFGGRDPFLERYKSFFSSLSGKDTVYDHENEPAHQAPYQAVFAGRPDLTQEIVRSIVRKEYKATPDGIRGNDDCGQMGAWYVFACLGFYPFDACTGTYVIGAPQIPKATLRIPTTDRRLPAANIFTVIANGLSEGNKYVMSVTLNGRPIADWKIRHEDIVKGGELVFEMGDKK